MRITAEPRSDQWNADDFVGGPRTFTIAGVKEGKAEQKYDIELVEGEGRVWRPPLTVRRLLIAAWGDESTKWIGRRVTLYRDESVSFGSDAVGGIRVSHMSDLPTGNAPFTEKFQNKRGKRTAVTVDPLPPTITAEAAAELEQRIAQAASTEALQAIGAELKAMDLGAHREQLQTAWSARNTELKGAAS